MNPDDIKILVHAYFDRLYNERDLSICDAVLSPNFVDHDAPPGTSSGPDWTKEITDGLLSMYPNLKVQVIDVIVSGNKTVIEITRKGNHQETGTELSQRGNLIIHLDEDGYFTEQWSTYQPIHR